MSCLGRVRRVCEEFSWCLPLASFVAVFQGGGEAHGFSHTVRVLCNVLMLAEGVEGVDLEVLVAAVLLHDVGRGFEEEVGVHHAVLSGFVAERVLPGLGFPRGKVEHVVKAILEHSFSLGLGHSSLESCLLGDADRLDALGAIGFYRMVETGAVLGRTMVDTVAHFWDKLVKLPEMMCSERGRVLALERLERLRRMVEMVREEMLEYEEAVAWLEAEAVHGVGVWRRSLS